MEKLERKLKICRLYLSYARLQIHRTKANFNPDQPRIPAGDPRGGEWTAINHSGSQDEVPSSEKNTPKVDLRKEENYRGAHTLRYHVGKTDMEILLRMGPPARWWMPRPFVMYRNGSFDSYGDADYFVNKTIARNIETVRLVSSGILQQAFLITRFGHRTGVEGFRETPYSEAYLRVAYEVGVQIIHDRDRPNGFYINTAYPRNDEPMRKNVTPPTVFLKFTSYMIQDFELFESLDAVLLFGLMHLTKTERNELLAFLRSTLRPDIPNSLIGKLWNKSNAEFGSDDDGIRWLLQRTADLIEKDDGTDVYYNRPFRS
ncbi:MULTISPECIES: hypothetical protein [Rhizobium/Agrobacterium group]